MTELLFDTGPADTWERVSVSNPTLRGLRDRHYSGGEGGRTVGAPGPRLAFLTGDGRAGWVSHGGYWALGDGYVCSFFRNEGDILSSLLVRAAVDLTEDIWGPPARWITLVDATKTRRKRDPGRCFRKAGFREDGRTKDAGLVILVLDR